MQPILSIKNLSIGFKLLHSFHEVVRDISFDIMPNETVALVGESGSGKSVTAQAIMGILPDIGSVSQGQILFHEKDKPESDVIDIAKLNNNSSEMRNIRGGSISIIFQEPMTSLSPVHTIGDQVSEALFLHRNISKAKGLELTEKMLEMVGFPDPSRAMSSYAFELSGGLRQRAMIAMSLVCQPSLLIADEPTTALDVTIQAQIIQLLKSLQEELGMSILLITHDLGVVANMADKMVVMYHGNIVESGPVKELFLNAKHPYLISLLNAIPHFDMEEDERLVPIREIENNIGEFTQEQYHLKSRIKSDNKDDIILKIDQLNRSFYKTQKTGFFKSEDVEIKAVNDVSLEIKRGESFGLVGESGCGKSTFCKLIMKALQPDSGALTFFESANSKMNDSAKSNAIARDIMNLSSDQEMHFRRNVQYVFQDPFSSLNPRMTIFDILKEPLVIHKIGNANSRVNIVKELMSMVGLDTRFVNRYPHSFSGGQRQRICIARALALSPELIICDEPVSALDVSIQAQILNLFKDLKEQLDLTYIFISHNLAVINYIADRVGVMAHGRIVELADKDDLFNHPKHPYTQVLLDAVPYIDLDHPINFQRIMTDKYDNESYWPEPFTITEKLNPILQPVDKASNHWVRMTV